MTVTARQRIQAREAILRWHQELRPGRPRCGAKRKHDGEQCQQLALANGRCHYHGGRTGSGKSWHKTKWPKGSAPDVEKKLVRKLRDQAKAEKARAKRLAAMTADQLAKYKEWHRSRKPGPPAARRAKRAVREQAAWLADLLAKDELEHPSDYVIDIFS